MTDRVALGDPPPARSRHAGRRSAVALVDGLVVAGTAGGRVRAFGQALAERWATDSRDASVVAAVPFAGGVAVGERGPRGGVELYDATGRRRWRHETAAEVGQATTETRFQLPVVAAVATGERRLYAAARRYERDGDERRFESRVYAFAPDGSVAWTHAADASPVALSVRDDRVAVAYNRCPGGHDVGLVILDDDGAVRCRWDPPGDGTRRVGDVALLDDGAAVASHADKRGYRLGPDGAVRWRVDLGTETVVGGERVYAYPNHAAAVGGTVAFVTGNTYPVEGRETEARHPNEHAVAGCRRGERRWTASVGGFASGVAAGDETLAVPGAQHFRDRDAAVHGLRTFGPDGPRATVETEGVVTAVAADEERVAAVEEPVVYHDEGVERGAYRLLVE